MARVTGVEGDRETGTEAAEAAWLKLMRAEWEDQTMNLIYRAQAGKAGPAAFIIEKASREDLLWTMERIEKRPKSPGLRDISEAISTERSMRQVW